MINLRFILILLVGLLSNSIVNAQQVQKSDKNIVRILSFNVLHGATTKGNFDLDLVAKVINETKPDLVALQEVDFKTNRANKLDIATELALRTSMTSYFAKAMEYDGGEYGQGILSKWTFLEARNRMLPHQPENEPRIVAETIVTIPAGDTIRFLGTHLDHLGDDSERIDQTRQLNRIVLDSIPTILAGDLNDTPESTPIEMLKSQWGLSHEKEKAEPTFPSDSPEIKIDYVMYHPKNRWKVLETRTICNEVASDHCAYLAVLRLLPDHKITKKD